MPAVVGDRYGSAEVLELRTAPTPTPGAGEVLVRVRAAGVSRGVWHLMKGHPLVVRLGFGLRSPKRPIPGLELSGTVVEVGEAVTRFSPGDEVFGMGLSTYAAYAVAPEAKLARRPEGLTPVEAAAMSDSASTALQAVRDHAGVVAGQRVLILGGSGGVGTFAVQIAKALGAEVTATASTAKVDLVRSLGADEVIDHRTTDATDLVTGAAPYDAIIDIGGNTPLRRLRRALAPEGTLVIVGGEQSDGKILAGFGRNIWATLRSLATRQTLKMFIAEEDHAYLEDLAALVAAGDVRPSVDRTYPLADAAQALDRLEAGEARGKLVIAVDAD
ncbi:MAG: NAD(P)-dependent alcohol dehydrogenase [Acidimicrobiales bacterium]|nr:NAD(P)-dependent alcohol dehydrogenase [Acidimicrobiales bacterium]